MVMTVLAVMIINNDSDSKDDDAIDDEDDGDSDEYDVDGQGCVGGYDNDNDEPDDD